MYVYVRSAFIFHLYCIAVFLIVELLIHLYSGLTNLKCLQISCSKVTDFGITYLKGIFFCNSLYSESKSLHFKDKLCVIVVID